MNINDLTIGQAKELVEMFGTANSGGGFYQRYIGKSVLVRSRNEGLNYGIVEACDATGIVLKNARRLWYHEPLDKSQSWYEGVANSGLTTDSKISAPVMEKAIIENYSVILVSEDAQKSIEALKSHARS